MLDVILFLSQNCLDKFFVDLFFMRLVCLVICSGVVYGLVAFIFWNGIFRKDLKSIILLLIVTILYSGMLYGIVPSQPGISWESHLFGGIMGILVAFMMRRFEIREDDDIELQTPKPLSEADKEYYFEKDIFDQKLKEREPQNRRL